MSTAAEKFGRPPEGVSGPDQERLRVIAQDLKDLNVGRIETAGDGTPAPITPGIRNSNATRQIEKPLTR